MRADVVLIIYDFGCLSVPGSGSDVYSDLLQSVVFMTEIINWVKTSVAMRHSVRMLRKCINWVMTSVNRRYNY